MDKKKAQAGIITVVLIVLIVLAGIVVVWQVVSSAIGRGAREVETQSSCMGVNLVIARATEAAENNVVIRRDPGAADYKKIDGIIFINDVRTDYNVTDLTVMDTRELTIPGLQVGNEIQVSAEVRGDPCRLSPKFKVEEE